jgi:hypothetical protein
MIGAASPVPGTADLVLAPWMMAGGAVLLGLGGVRPRRVLLEWSLLALATVGLALGTLPAGAGPWPATATILAAWALPWALAHPLRVLGFRGGATVLGLGSFGFLLVLPILVGREGLVSQGFLVRGALPGWALQLSPLARLHGSVLGTDWFHAPGLYPRVGEAYYAYPAWGEGLWVPAISALLALLLGFLGVARSEGVAPAA